MEPEKTTRIEIDTDDLDDDQLDALSRLAKRDDIYQALEVEASSDAFGSLDELIRFEELEEAGCWVEWPDVPGARLLIAHNTAGSLKLAKLERAFREKHGVRIGHDLSDGAKMDLYRDSLFGTVVKGWSGMVLEGRELPFDEKTFRTIWKVRRFRNFVAVKSRDMEALREQMLDDAGEA